MENKRPKCDCGSELLLNKYNTENNYYTITKDGNRKSKKQHHRSIPTYTTELKELFCMNCKNTYEILKQETDKPKYRRGKIKDDVPF